MNRRMKLILILCGVGIFIAFIFLLYLRRTWVFLPTKSSSHTLTLVRYGYPSPSRITLRHYVDDVPINEYILELKGELWSQVPQSYELPQLNEGMVEINVELKNGIDHSTGSLTINYEEARDLYEKGLLIYFNTAFHSNITIGNFVYYDQYVYFVSKKERISYFEKAGSSEWVPITNAPPLKKFVREGMGYSPYFGSGWQEKNKWVVMPVNNKPDN